MNRPAVKDARFHYLGAVCHLAARDYATALELGRRAAADDALNVESHYVMAWAHLHLNDADAARQRCKRWSTEDAVGRPRPRPARPVRASPRGDYDDAIKWWNAGGCRPAGGVEASRSRCGRRCYLAGLTALEKQRFEQAAERFREAGQAWVERQTPGRPADAGARQGGAVNCCSARRSNWKRFLTTETQRTQRKQKHWFNITPARKFLKVVVTLRGCDFIGKWQNPALENKDLRRGKRRFANKITASPAL